MEVRSLSVESGVAEEDSEVEAALETSRMLRVRPVLGST